MIEMWKDIEGYEGLYQISNFGNVKSYPKTWLCGGANNAPLNEFKHSGKILKQSLRSNGYFHPCNRVLGRGIKWKASGGFKMP